MTDQPRTVPDPIDIEVRRNVRIQVRDGLELSANLWLPAGAGPDRRYPAILEMIPYRKDDWRANADEARGRYLARHGYVLCRLEARHGGLDGAPFHERRTATAIPRQFV